MEEGGEDKKIEKLTRSSIRRMMGETLLQHKRRITKSIDSTTGEIAVIALQLQICNDALLLRKQTLHELESELHKSVTLHDIQGRLQRARAAVVEMEEQKVILEREQTRLQKLLDETVKYRRTLDAKPNIPKIEL